MSATESDQPSLQSIGEQIVDKLDGVGKKVDVLVVSQAKLTRANRRRVIFEILIGAATAVAIGALIIGTKTLVELRASNRCLTVVVAATADRTGSLAPLNKALQDAKDAKDAAKDKVFADAFPEPGKPIASRAQFEADGAAVRRTQAAFEAAKQAYDEAYVAHPPPLPPSQTC